MRKPWQSLQLISCFWIVLFYSGNVPKVTAHPLLLPDSSYFQCFLTTELPSFPPGNIQEWLKQHLIYPPQAFEKNIEGKVNTFFIIDTTGKVQDIRIFRSTDSIFNNEAISVIQKMPTWIPGKDKGKPVKISYTLPVTFVLNEAILQIADEMPVFPQRQLRKWLQIEVQKCYKSSGINHSITGISFVSMIIEKDGRVTYPEIVRSSGFTELDAEAIRIVNRMPRWKPGKHQGRPVHIRFMVPISFPPV